MQMEQSKLVRPRKIEMEKIATQGKDEISIPDTFHTVGISAMEDEYIAIPLTDLSPDPNQARHDFSKIKALKESIQQNGQLQPITVIKNSEGKYEIRDGECRWRAMTLLAQETEQNLSEVRINAIYKHGELDENIGLIINLLRNEYSPFETAFAIQKLQKSKPTMTLEQIGSYIGKSRQNVGEYLNLLRLPEKIKEHAIENNIVPFYILKQLAANPKLSEQEKIDEYERLISERTDDSSEIQTITDITYAEKEKDFLPRPNRKFNSINKKIDAVISSFNKFNLINVETTEERESLSKKLEMLIKQAKELKHNLMHPMSEAE